MPRKISKREKLQKWVKALRSGQYKQGRLYLHRDDEWCCLGVACEVYRKETGRGKWVPVDDFPGVSAFRVGNHHERPEKSALPDVVMNWFGIRAVLGGYMDKAGFTNLSSQNDRNNEHRSFAEIADIIESIPPELFTMETEEELRHANTTEREQKGSV